MESIADILTKIAAEMAQRMDQGKVANYIPELACIDPAKFEIAVVMADGQVFSAGDAAEPFSIQSVSKVFTLAIALGRYVGQLWARVGRFLMGVPGMPKLVKPERLRRINAIMM